MFNVKAFWLTNNAILIVLYSVAGALLAQGFASHWIVFLAGAIVLAHVLELPIAANVLRSQNPAKGRLVIFTLLFGFTWWLPAKKGIYRCK